MRRIISLKDDRFIFGLIVLFILMSPSVSYAKSQELETIKQFFLKGEYERVIDRLLYLNLDTSAVEPFEALYFIGVSMIKVGRYADARDVLSRIIQRRPKIKFRDQIELRIADAFLAEEALEIALKRYQNVMVAFPQSSGLAHAYRESALICQRLGKFDQAQSYFKLLQINCPLSFEASNLRRGRIEQITHFGIEVGAFADSFNAEHLRTELETKGFQPYVKMMHESKVPLYRVLVGEFDSRKDAESTMVKLQSLGYPAQVYP